MASKEEKAAEAPTAGSEEEETTTSDLVIDKNTQLTVQKIPLLTIKAGPRDKDQWIARLKQELNALIKYVQNNKASDNDWFLIESNKTGTEWKGKCWYVYKMVKYEYDLQFEIPVSYPTTPFEIVLPELEGKTPKMYRGGKICLSLHFKPLWSKNVPHFGIAHALAMGLGPWLAAEIPYMVDQGIIAEKSNSDMSKSAEKK